MHKHGESFDEAVSVFGDTLALTFSDTDHSEAEERSRTYRISNKERLLIVVHTERRNGIRIISARKTTRYKKGIYKMANHDIPELKRDEPGKGVRSKYLKHFIQGSNVVVLQPEILKASPTSEAVHKALASMLAFAHETQGLIGRSSRTSHKRAAA